MKSFDKVSQFQWQWPLLQHQPQLLFRLLLLESVTAIQTLANHYYSFPSFRILNLNASIKPSQPEYTMVSFRTTFLALATALTVAADYYIDPNSVDLGTRSTMAL